MHSAVVRLCFKSCVRVSAVGVIALLVAGLFALPAAAQPKPKDGTAYTIKLDRPRHTGERFHISSFFRSDQHLTVTMRGKVRHAEVVQQQDSSYEIWTEADAEVLDSATAELMLTVRKCHRVNKSDTTVLAPPGARIRFRSQADKERMESVDSDIKLQNLLAIDEAFPGTVRNIADNIIGTKRPQTVGSTWAVNAAGVAEGISARESMVVKAKDISGEVRLANIGTTQGVPTMRVEATVSIKKFAIPELRDVVMKRSSGAVTVSGVFPVDETRPAMRSSMSLMIGMEATMKQKAGQPTLDLMMQASRSVSTEYTDLP